MGQLMHEKYRLERATQEYADTEYMLPEDRVWQ